MKKTVIALIILAAIFGSYRFYQNKKISQSKTIDNLTEYFKSFGLIVSNQQISEEEKQFAEGFGQAIDSSKKALGIKTNKDKAPIEHKTFNVNSIEISVFRYKTGDAAKNNFDYQTGLEGRKAERSKKENSPYFKTEHFLNKNFYMAIRHFDVKIEKGYLIPLKLELNENDLNKIREIFNSFKP